MSTGLILGIAALFVVLPLAREYADLRRAWGLGRAWALATTLLVLPALVVGIVLALPLATRPSLQWLATVLVTLVLYSGTARAIVATASAAATAPSRRT